MEEKLAMQLKPSLIILGEEGGSTVFLSHEVTILAGQGPPVP